jgi:hypothetical protein
MERRRLLIRARADLQGTQESLTDGQLQSDTAQQHDHSDRQHPELQLAQSWLATDANEVRSDSHRNGCHAGQRKKSRQQSIPVFPHPSHPCLLNAPPDIA